MVEQNKGESGVKNIKNVTYPTVQDFGTEEEDDQSQKQGTDEWKALRATRLTASAFSNAVGFWRDGRNALWEEKLKRLYAHEMLKILQNAPNLKIREAMVTGLEIEHYPKKIEDHKPEIQERIGFIKGVKTYFGSVFHAKAVVLTTGTFLGGKIGRASCRERV